MGLQQQEAVGPVVDALQQVGEGGEVAEALRHLLPRRVDDKGVVHPVAGELAAEHDGVGPLVLVMGELEVEAAGVQVETVTQQVEAHGHALGVPARAAVAPRRRPGGLAGLGQLPEHEVEGAALLLPPALVHPLGGPQVPEVLLGQEAVALDLRHRQVHTVGGWVGRSLLDELLYDLDHPLYEGRGPWRLGGTEGAEPVHRRPPLGLVPACQHAGVLPPLVGPVDDVVVDVGDVRDVAYPQAAPLEESAEDVVGEDGPAVAHVGQVVDGGPADVQRHLAGIAEAELADEPGCRVVQPEHALSVEPGQRRSREGCEAASVAPRPGAPQPALSPRCIVR